MTKLTFYLLIFNIILSNIGYAELPIIPVPQIVEYNKDTLRLDYPTDILILGDKTDKNLFSAEELKRTYKEIFNIDCDIIHINKIKENHNKKSIIFDLEDSSKLVNIKYSKFNKESYYLIIEKERITIKAFDAAGIFYGTQSLIQLIEKAKNKKIPCLKIVDWPDMKLRGISDDISRGQVSNMENFYKIIRQISRHKMNTYMPYIEDVLQLDSFPSIGKDRGALTKSEVKQLLNYAQKYFVEVIPVFQTLGHYENILSQDEFIKYAEFPGAASLNVSSDSTYIFLEKMLKEVFELFPSKYINIGADESYDVGLGKSKEMVNKSDIATVHSVHYKRVYDICKKYNKKVMMYSDIVLQFPKIIELIPKDIIMIDWHYNASDDYKSTSTFKDAGFNYLVSPSVWNFVTDFPVNSNALPNIKNITESGITNSSLGMINSNWGDYGAETFKELNYFSYAWSAQCSWNIRNSDIYSFTNNFFFDFFGIDDYLNNQIYQNLSNVFNLVSWHDLWRHPLLPLRDPAYFEGKRNITVKLNWMQWTLPKTSEYIDLLQTKTKKNKDHYDLLKFILKLNKYYVLKTQTQLLLNNKLNNVYIEHNNLYQLIDSNIVEINKLKNEFSSLWLKYYKKDNLILIDRKFERLIAYFTEVKESLLKDNLVSPVIKSSWIYFKSDDSNLLNLADFKKEFKLALKPDSAFLQFLGDSYATLYINDTLVSKTFVRSSLSLTVENKKFKIINITKYLKEGDNSIKVHCENFNIKEKTGFNLFAEIYTNDKTTDILSDLSWLGKLPNSNKWDKVSEYKISKTVVAPNFKTKRTSWMER